MSSRGAESFTRPASSLLTLARGPAPRHPPSGIPFVRMAARAHLGAFQPVPMAPPRHEPSRRSPPAVLDDRPTTTAAGEGQLGAAAETLGR